MRLLRTAIALVVIVAAAVVWLVPSHTQYRTITAAFAETPGLYKNNRVDILGMPVGKITRIKATGTEVLVTMQVPMRYPVPANASAVLEAPEVVNDRYVQLQPAWAGGPVMGRTATIPLSRTNEPLTTDRILGSLDALLAALGPTASNSAGVLSSLITTLNQQLGGHGAALHDTIASTSTAVAALAADSPQLSQTIDHIASFVKTAAASASTYQDLTTNLAGAAADLDSDRTSLAQALSQLRATLTDVTHFIQANASSLKGSLDNLNQFTSTVAANEQSVAQTLRILPLFLENTQNAVQPTPYGTAIAGRLDVLPSIHQFVHTFCGKDVTQTVRANQIFMEQQQAPKMDLLCTFGGALISYATPPGLPSNTPDLSVQSIYSSYPH